MLLELYMAEMLMEYQKEEQIMRRKARTKPELRSGPMSAAHRPERKA